MVSKPSTALVYFLYKGVLAERLCSLLLILCGCLTLLFPRLKWLINFWLLSEGLPGRHVRGVDPVMGRT